MKIKVKHFDKDNLPPGYSLSSGRAKVAMWKEMVTCNLSDEDAARYLELWDRYSPFGGHDRGLSEEELREFRYLERLSRGGVK